MAKFVHHDGQEMLTARIAEIIGIVDAAPAIMFGIHQDDDVLVGRSSQQVVQTFQMERRQIAVAVEGVEV